LLLLSPEVVATGHGKSMNGKEMRRQLHYLHEHFYEEFVPQHGRYVYEPAVADANGVLYVPPAAYNPYTKWLVAGVAAIITATTLTVIIQKKRSAGLLEKFFNNIIHSNI
jgi:hypothetical protein